MSDSLTLQGDHRHEYHLRATVNGHEVDLILDSGFTDVACQVGVALDAANYGAIRRGLHHVADIPLRSLDAVSRPAESGIATVTLVGLDGSEIETRIVNAGENLLGVCYLHRLSGFTVSWDLASRTMRISRITAESRP